MAIPISANAPTLCIRRVAYERCRLERPTINDRLGLSPDEFRAERGLVAIGPVQNADALQRLIRDLEDIGLEYFDDFFELSGNWPEWLELSVTAPMAT